MLNATDGQCTQNPLENQFKSELLRTMNLEDNTPDEGLTPQQAEQLAHVLSQHPNYRILRRLDLAGRLAPLESGVRVALVDTETTGVDANNDAIIELGILVVLVDPATGQAGPVVDRYSELEDPGFPIPPASTEIHGITDDMVKGKAFDEQQVRKVLKDVHLVVAHNAGFDRAFLEKRFDFMQDMPFGCSYREIDWRAEGYGSAALEFLVYRLGCFYDGHRAIHDCEALLALLAQPLPESGRMPFAVLFESANEPEFVIHALKSAIETKDVLKARGFRWSAEERVWKMGVQGELQGREMIEWLKREVYRCQPEQKVMLGFEKRTAQRKYSRQQVKVSIKEV
jgi:DNA polymerase-3 subunit epsilon